MKPSTLSPTYSIRAGTPSQNIDRRKSTPNLNPFSAELEKQPKKRRLSVSDCNKNKLDILVDPKKRRDSLFLHRARLISENIKEGKSQELEEKSIYPSSLDKVKSKDDIPEITINLNDPHIYSTQITKISEKQAYGIIEVKVEGDNILAENLSKLINLMNNIDSVKVVSLDLSNKSIDDEILNSLANTISGKILYLDLSDNNISEIGIIRLNKSFPMMDSLLLNNNRLLSDKSIDAFSHSFSSRLKILGLSGINLTDRGLNKIIERFENLMELDVSHNQIHLESYIGSEYKLPRRGPGLQGWYKHQINKFNVEIGQGQEYFYQNVMTKLRTLNLSYNYISGSMLFKIPEFAPHLLFLNISNNDLGGNIRFSSIVFVEKYSSISDVKFTANHLPPFVSLFQTDVKIPHDIDQVDLKTTNTNLNGELVSDLDRSYFLKNFISQTSLIDNSLFVGLITLDIRNTGLNDNTVNQLLKQLVSIFDLSIDDKAITKKGMVSIAANAYKHGTIVQAPKYLMEKIPSSFRYEYLADKNPNASGFEVKQVPDYEGKTFEIYDEETIIVPPDNHFLTDLPCKYPVLILILSVLIAGFLHIYNQDMKKYQ